MKKNTSFDLLYSQFKQKIVNDENRDQVEFLCRKSREAIKEAKKIAKKEGLTESQLFLCKVYIFIFHYRLIDLNKQTTKNEIQLAKDFNHIQGIFVDDVARHFELSPLATKDIKLAFAEITEPVGRTSPKGIKVGHDAIMSIFGKKKAVDKLNSLFNELEFYFPSLKNYFSISNGLIEYMAKAKLHSPYAINNFLTRKIKNKGRFIKYLQKQKEGASLLNNKHAMTMIKTSSRNQVDLVNIADNKAGIMITVNSILLTLLIPMFASYLFDFSSYIIPVAILTVTCGLTILLATLATRPSKVNDDISGDKIHTGQKSIFYFKNFANLSKTEFVTEAQELIASENVFEKSVFTDLYDVGIDLDRKYKRLRWCYTIFGTGIVLTMVSFILSIVFTSI